MSIHLTEVNLGSHSYTLADIQVVLRYLELGTSCKVVKSLKDHLLVKSLEVKILSKDFLLHKGRSPCLQRF